MKRNLLFLLTIFLTTVLSAQVAPALLTTTGYDEDEFEINYTKDCSEKEMNELREDSNFGLERMEEPLKIFPNPTTEYISVSNNSAVSYLYIYNIIGRRVKSFPVFAGGQYSLRDLPDGMYLVSMVDSEGRILKTVRTSKSMPRP